MVAATCSATTHGRAHGRGRSACVQSSGSSTASAPTRRPDLDIARRAGADRLVARADRASRVMPRRDRRIGEDAVDGGEHVVGRAERQRQRRRRSKRGLGVADALRRTRARCRRRIRAPRPGTNRSTASRRRRQRRCGGHCRARRGRQKNSSASRFTTSHWSGLVSCASSSRMWSMPWSSLYCTQGPASGRASRLTRAGDQVVEIEEAARRVFSCS